MQLNERIVSGKPHVDDTALDRSLRPRRLEDYIGQERLKANLNIGIVAAKQRGDALDHTLLYGPPAWARLRWPTSWPPRWASGSRPPQARPSSVPGDMVAILTQLQKDDILFVDEIHRLSRVVEEVLYPAMETSSSRGLSTRV